jgi:hypothetical protein
MAWNASSSICPAGATAIDVGAPRRTGAADAIALAATLMNSLRCMSHNDLASSLDQ